MWRNEYEIADICDDLAHSEDKRLVAYALVLVRWVNVVNSHSDGWPYWKAGAKAAERLSDLLARATGRAYGVVDRDYVYSRPAGSYVPTDAELRATLTPMKSLATKRGLPSPLAPLEALASR